MTEYYAKITPMSKGMFNYHVVIWRSHNGIDSVWNEKSFFKIFSAKKWSEKIIAKSIAKEKAVMFIKEPDVIRRKWND